MANLLQHKLVMHNIADYLLHNKDILCHFNIAIHLIIDNG